jgi:hypothetical protein
MAVEAKDIGSGERSEKCQVEGAMARFFLEEKDKSDNAPRKNFVFMAYPFTPPIPQR